MTQRCSGLYTRHVDDKKQLFTYCLINPRHWHVPFLLDNQHQSLNLCKTLSFCGFRESQVINIAARGYKHVQNSYESSELQQESVPFKQDYMSHGQQNLEPLQIPNIDGFPVCSQWHMCSRGIENSQCHERSHMDINFFCTIHLTVCSSSTISVLISPPPCYVNS